MCESSEGSVAEADSLQRFRNDPSRLVDIVSRGLVELKYNFVQEVERLQQTVHRNAGPLQPHGCASTQPLAPHQDMLTSQSQSIQIQRPTSIPQLSLGNAVSRVPSPPLSPAVRQQGPNPNLREFPAMAVTQSKSSNSSTNGHHSAFGSIQGGVLVEAPTTLLAAANMPGQQFPTDSSHAASQPVQHADSSATDDHTGSLNMRRPLDAYSSNGSVANSMLPRNSLNEGASSDFNGTQGDMASRHESVASLTSAVVSSSAVAAAAALAAAAAASPTMAGANPAGSMASAAATVAPATSSPRSPLPTNTSAAFPTAPAPIPIPTPTPAGNAGPSPAPVPALASPTSNSTSNVPTTPSSPVGTTATPAPAPAPAARHLFGLQSGRSFFGSGVSLGGDNTRKSRLESLTHAYNQRMSVTEGAAPKRALRQQTGMLRNSPTTLSDFLYADDRAAKQAAQEKGILEVLKSNERSAQSLPEPVPVVKKFVESLTFELFMGVAIFTNSLLIGIEVQYRTVAWTTETPLPFYLVSHFYAILFTCELILRIKTYGPYELFIVRGIGWAWLDLLIVMTALTEMALDLVYLLGDSEGRPTGFTGLNQVRVTRILRITRLVRTLRIQRIIRFVAPLRTLVFSILATLRSLTWAMVLLILLVYVAGVVVAQGALDFLLENEGFVGDQLSSELREYWVSLDRAMFTLFQTFTGGVSWRETIGCLEQVSFVFSWLVTAFISFVFFAMLNVMTGVFCSSAIETAQRNPEVIATSMISSRNAYTENLRTLFQSVDEDGTGLVTLIELEKLLKNELMSAHLRALEIDVSDAWTLFRLLDTDRSGVIEVEEFLSGCEHLKGHAKGIDLATLGFEVRNLGRKFVKFMKSTEKQLDELQNGPPQPKMLDEFPGERPLHGVLSGGTGPTGSEPKQKHSGS